MAEEKFKTCPFSALMVEKEKKTSQFKEMISLEYEWLSSVLEDLPAMLPKEEFVVLPTKTPSKKKAVKGSAQPLPPLELDDSGSNVPSLSSGTLSVASNSSRTTRKPKVSKAKGSKQAQKAAADVEALAIDDGSNQGPLTLADLRCPASPAPSQSGRRLRSTRASKRAVAAATTSPKQSASTRSTRSTRQAASRKLSTHSRNCPFSPRRAADLPPAASTPDSVAAAAADQRKQRTLRLKRNAAANKRLFLTPEKKKELFGLKIFSPEKAKEASPAAAVVTKAATPTQPTRQSVRRTAKAPASEAEPVPLPAESGENSCADIAEHFMTANESPIEKQVTTTIDSSQAVLPPMSPEVLTKACLVKITPLKQDAIQRWLESANPIDVDLDDDIFASEEEPVTAVEEKENQPTIIEAVKEQRISDRKSSAEKKRSLRLSRKRSSHQADLSDPVASAKILKEDNRAGAENPIAVEEEEEEEEYSKDVQKKEGEEKADPKTASGMIEEEEEAEDDIAPLPAVPIIAAQTAKADVSADESFITDDEWSTLNDDEVSVNSLLNQSSVSAGHINTPSENRPRPRLAHSADGGAKRFSRVKRWMSGSSKRSSSTDQGSSRLSNLSNMSTPGRMQKRLSGNRRQEMEEERRRELKERMQKDLKRMQEREWRLAQEREEKKRANEARRQQVLSKRDAVYKEKIISIQQNWEKKEQQLAEQERDRKEEEQRRKLALAQLRKQNEQREREERERREAETQRQRDEARRKMKEDMERRAREAERRAKEEAERRLKEEAAKKAREEEERRAKEAERRAREAERRAAEAARRMREEEKRRQEEEERKRAILRERAMQLEMVRKEFELSGLKNAIKHPGELLAKKTKRSEENYDISDLHSDQETDDDEDPRKKVPAWATKSAMERKCRHFARLNVKWWRIFRPAETLVVDLNSIFAESKRSFRPRTSSAIWQTPPGFKATTTPKH